MAKRVGIEKAIRILREVEVLQGQGSTIGEACRKVGVSEYTYYRWKKEYGRLRVDQVNPPTREVLPLVQTGSPNRTRTHRSGAATTALSS